MAVGRSWVDPATTLLHIEGLVDPPQNFRAAVHRDWLEDAGAGAEIALENLADYTRGDLIVGGATDWEDLALGTRGYVLGSNGTDIFWSSVHLDEHAPTGFPNRADTSISFADGNRTLTLAKTNGSFDVYVKGVKYTFTSNQTKQIDDTEGTWWFYFNSAGTLTAGQVIPELRDNALVALVYWDAVGNTALDLAEERHGMTMDGATHSLLHYTVGTRWESGLAAGDYTLVGDGDTDADAQLSIADGVVDDEDLPAIITDDSPQNLAPIAYIPVYYLDGATPVWRKTTADAFPLFDNATDEISYNLDTAGTWSQPAATNNYYVAMWIFATTNVVEPIVAILGQRQDSKLGDAQDSNTYESLVFDTLPFQEMKVIYRLIFNTRYPQYTNTPHAKLVDIVDLRSVSNLPAGTYVATAHGSLTGRDARYSHPASAISVDLTNMDHLLSGLVAPTTDDVQAALEIMDDILVNPQTIEADWTWSNSSKINFSDTDLFIYSPADTILELSADGHVRIGNSAHDHLAGTADSLLVSGKFEVDSTAYFDSSVEMYNVLTFFNATETRVHFYETAVADGLVVVAAYDTAEFMLAVGAPCGRQIIISDAANYTKDYDHAVQTNPTLFVQSGTDPDSASDEWWSITHDVTDAIYAVGSGLHRFTAGNIRMDSTLAIEFFDAAIYIQSPADTIGRMVADGYWQVGTGTPTHIAGTANSFHVSGKLEVDGAGYFDGTIDLFPLTPIRFLEGAAVVSAIYRSATHDHMAFTLGIQIDHQLLITDYANRAKNHGHADLGYPALYVHGVGDPEAAGATHWWSVVHDATDAVYNLGSGVHKFIGGAINVFDNSDAASVQLQILEGDRATETDDDEIYMSWKLANDADEQTEFARISAVATDVSDGTEDGAFGFKVMVNGALTEVFRADATFATNWTDLTDAGNTALHTHTVALADLADYAQGSLIIGTGADWAAVARGAAGTILMSGAADLSWTTTFTADMLFATGIKATFRDANQYVASDNANELSLHAGAAGVVSYTVFTLSHATAPVLRFYETGAGADAKRWDWVVFAEHLYGRAVNDANDDASPWLDVTRAGFVPGVAYMVMAEDGWIGNAVDGARFVFDDTTPAIILQEAVLKLTPPGGVGSAVRHIYFDGQVFTTKTGADEYVKVATGGGDRYLKLYT